MKTKREEDKIKKTRAACFAALWLDPKYIRLTDRQAKLIRLSVREDAYVNHPRLGDPAKAARLRMLATRASRRVQAYENAALAKVGMQP